MNCHISGRRRTGSRGLRPKRRSPAGTAALESPRRVTYFLEPNTGVTTVTELLPRLGSGAPAIAEAVFTTVEPPGRCTVTTSVIVAAAPLFSVPRLHVTVPVV